MNHPLSSLPARLAALGISAAYLTFGDGNLRTWDWEVLGGRLVGDARAAWEFTLLQKRLPAAEAERLFGRETIAELVAAGIARKSRGGVSLGQTALIQFLQRPFLVEFALDSRALFSEDAKAVIASLPTMEYRRCLSLYTGCGIEAFALRHREGSELSLGWPDGSPKFLQAAWRLGGGESTFKLLADRAVSAATGHDLILARVPCWSLPTAFAKAMSRPGGPDGLAEMERFLKLAGKALSKDGTAVFSGVLYDGESLGAAWEHFSKLAKAHGLCVSALCSSKQVLEPGIPLFNHMMGFVEHRARKPAKEILERLVNHFGERSRSHAYFLRGTVRRGDAAPALVDLSEHYYGNWSI